MVTAWLRQLCSDCELRLEPVAAGASLRLWHANIHLEAIDLAPGRRLTNAETWNGKPLVYLPRPSLPAEHTQQASTERDEVAAEAALVQRFRDMGLDAYWSRGQKRWAHWILRSAPARQRTFQTLDAAIRPHHGQLAGNTRGLPDIVAWDRVSQEIYCIEYKGPQRDAPHHQDKLKDEQIAWFATGIDRGVLSPDRCAIVSWVPDPEACARLQRQSAASGSRRASPDGT